MKTDFNHWTEAERNEAIDAEATIDTLIECSPISETKAYKKLRKALNKLQDELEAGGIQGKWRSDWNKAAAGKQVSAISGGS